MRILAKTILLTTCLIVSLVANAQWTEPASDVVSTTDKVVIDANTQLIPRLTLTGQEFHQAGITSTDGLSLLLGVNRATNRQLWIVDSTQMTPRNSTNAALRFLVGAGTADISGIATDGMTPKNVIINGGGGDVGIGTTSVAGAKLLVVDNRFAVSTPLSVLKESTLTTNAGDTDFGSYFRTHEHVGDGAANTSGVVGMHNEAFNTGPGTAANVDGLRLYAGVQAGAGVVTNAYGARIYVQAGNGTVTNGYGLYVADVAGTTKSFGIYQVAAGDRNYFGGHVNVGGEAPAEHVSKKLYVLGDAYVDGTLEGDYIKAHYQDVAEWVPSNDDLAPGTVVVLDASIGNGVMASNRAYDTTVAGVVSAQPGIILGVEGTSKEQVATTGRVRVKVDASRGAVAVGDLLVTSDKSGYAMRSTPIDVGGTSIHRPGTIVGKALEPLAEGTGELLVLLSLQ